MKKQIAAFITIVVLTGLGGCEVTPHRGEVQVRDRDYDVRVVFSDSDRRIIREYYREDYRRLPPGLAKKGKIPPGHAFKLKRNHGVPPDIKWGYLEPDIERRLSRLPDGFIRVVIGADVGIMNTRTRVIVDVLEDIND